jgi:hypothetical protein
LVNKPAWSPYLQSNAVPGIYSKSPRYSNSKLLHTLSKCIQSNKTCPLWDILCDMFFESNWKAGDGFKPFSWYILHT